jgi:hypothetical protein
MCRAFGTQGDMRNVSRIFVKRPEMKKQFGGPQLISEESTETYLEKGTDDSVDQVHVF